MKTFSRQEQTSNLNSTKDWLNDKDGSGIQLKINCRVKDKSCLWRCVTIQAGIFGQKQFSISFYDMLTL